MVTIQKHPAGTKKSGAWRSEDRALRRNTDSARIAGRAGRYLPEDHKGVRRLDCNQRFESELRTARLRPTLKWTTSRRLGYTEEASLPQEWSGALSGDPRSGKASGNHGVESASPLRLVCDELRSTCKHRDSVRDTELGNRARQEFASDRPALKQHQ
jgi:hypothetical protein